MSPTRDEPEARDAMLFCVTEATPPEHIDALVEALAAIGRRERVPRRGLRRAARRSTAAQPGRRAVAVPRWDGERDAAAGRATCCARRCGCPS